MRTYFLRGELRLYRKTKEIPSTNFWPHSNQNQRFVHRSRFCAQYHIFIVKTPKRTEKLPKSTPMALEKGIRDLCEQKAPKIPTDLSNLTEKPILSNLKKPLSHQLQSNKGKSPRHLYWEKHFSFEHCCKEAANVHPKAYAIPKKRCRKSGKDHGQLLSKSPKDQVEFKAHRP